MKLLVAGAGAFGRELMRTLARIDGVELAVADRRLEAAQSAANDFGCIDAGEDAVAMLERLRPAGIVVATPASSHLAITAQALAHGIPVLLEKPVALTVAEAEKMLGLERDSTAFVQPGHVLRFSAAHRQLADIVQRGEIGVPVSITSRRYRDASHAERYADIDQVLMTMVHDIDLAIWLSGASPVAAQAVRRADAGRGAVTDATVSDSLGGRWHLSTAWTFPAESVPADRIEVLGTRGAAELEVGRPLRVAGDKTYELEVDAHDDPIKAELECFVAGIEAGRNLAQVSLIDARDGLRAAEMILDALSSTDGGVTNAG